MLFFSIERKTQSLFQSIQYTKKMHRKKLHKKFPSQTDYKNQDISILQINQIIFYLSHVTIISEF